MGKSWDSTGIAYNVDMWKEVFRVLKPGGYLLSFGGSRTYHRMACAIEDAGFEIRDQIMWVYGCLDEKTEIATSKGVKPYHKTKVGDTVLCYDVLTKTYSYQPILEIVEYDYQDTAYRLIGDSFEQVVSKNHRVIVEQNGSETFHYAEALQSEANIPILESLPELQKALYDQQSDTGIKKQNLLKVMCQCENRGSQYREKSIGRKKRGVYYLRRLWGKGLETEFLVKEGESTDLFSSMQRSATGSGVDGTRFGGALLLDERIGSETESKNDWRNKPIVEGWGYLSQPKRFIRESVNKVCSVSDRISRNGSQRWLCNGTSDIGSNRNEKDFNSDRSSASHKPRCNGQCNNKSDAVQNQRGTQGIREWQGHKTSLVRTVPFQYTGKVWCLRVSTGAFVAVRDGVAFPTGNSGFPKSLDVAKAIDKMAGVEFEAKPASGVGFMNSSDDGYNTTLNQLVQTGESTDEANKWKGWGTALKPAHEPIVMARKPLSEKTVAKNVLEHGTGGINIDGSRIGTGTGETKTVEYPDIRGNNYNNANGTVEYTIKDQGRWPANFIHDGSDEVLELFPDTGKSTGGRIGKKDTSGVNIVPAGQYEAGDPGFGDSGSAARYFYCAKTSKKDRNEGLDDFEAKSIGPKGHGLNRICATCGTLQMKGCNCPDATYINQAKANHHPTVKPTDLMRYLVRMVTPPNGVVLDPFMGSGSTGKAAIFEGFNFVGVEQNPEYIKIAEARITAAEIK
jgi:site-specific DNA-methyltransferase (adenine-specific)